MNLRRKYTVPVVVEVGREDVRIDVHVRARTKKGSVGVALRTLKRLCKGFDVIYRGV